MVMSQSRAMVCCAWPGPGGVHVRGMLAEPLQVAGRAVMRVWMM